MEKVYSVVCSAVFTQKETSKKHSKVIYGISTHDTYDEAVEALKMLDVEDYILNMNKRIFRHWVTDEYEGKIDEVNRHVDEGNPWISVVSSAYNVADFGVLARKNILHIIEVPFE